MAKASLGSRKRTFVLRSCSARVLRSRPYGASKAPDHPVLADKSVNVTAGRKKKEKREKTSRKLNDEFSRIRKRLRYLLSRMSYEQSLIDAYSGEGWKGQSSEKIKPEKELQRASTEILRCKQEIRSLFQHIDSSCAEGRLQESLFDSDGQIYSEDIFCAKCGSKDLTSANDIILCDGMCYRGFHQMCLDPPLLKDEIPPGDESWLCPGCDCKVDNINLLNESLGTDLSTNDHWEKVFPEAAATAARDEQDGDLGLPSDDSEDDDYDPDGPQDDGKAQTEDSTFEESDFTSASEDSRAVSNDDLYVGLLSDDAEDNDYDPNAVDHDELIKKESSSSDFTSDSEDISASGDDSKSFDGVEVPESLSMDDAKSIRGSDPNATLVSGKRNVERLDYKKLHDETYGNVPSDSSDDEDWTDGSASRKGKSNFAGNCTMSTKGNSLTTMNGTNKDIKRSSRDTEITPERKTRQKLDIEGANKLVRCKQKDGSEPCSSEKLATASPSRSLGKAATQRLSESLRENQYPDRSTKEKLVKELGITLRQVSKWFENARRSLRLSANVGVSKADTIPPNKESIDPEPDKDAANSVSGDKRLSKTGSSEVIGTECCSKNEERMKSVTEESSQRKSATSKSRKRSLKDDEESDEMSNMEITKEGYSNRLDK
ncbi:homeobox protein HAT3.1 isoform X2 [Telopea speciosissima]|uniref:homeobox protein HAT3.1 isoform X2 n=1 Tax=Telopea speciosissima TaxID=54955 RepID=UPI001CC77CE5|nr:homeobox protein HAT3.1 isoform X2 [Telopea speciosissima]